MAKVGYARTSTIEQVAGFEAQIRELEQQGCDKIFREQLSSVAGERPQLEAMLDWVREGDEVIVTRVDRLARSVRDLVAIVERIRAKDAAIVIGGLGRINGDDPVSILLLNVLGAIAQFEREIMLVRQREGIAKAKAAGKYKGAPPKVRRQLADIERLIAAGLSKRQVAVALGVHVASVFRVLAEARAKA